MGLEHDRERTNAGESEARDDEVLAPLDEGHDLDLLFRALGNQECRLACYYLKARGEAMPVVELARLIAASTAEKAPTALTTDEIARTRASLNTNHLPKLEAAGVVRCDGPLVNLVDESSPAQSWLSTTFDEEIE